MNHRKTKWIVLIFALAVIMTLGACKKKVAPPPPPPPPPPAPTASLTADPAEIQQGQSTTLTWETSNATDVSIDKGVGSVRPNGSQSVTPQTSTTYTLTAKGPGGTQDATARVTVTAPPPPPPPPPTATEEQIFMQNVHDIYFDFDKYDIRPDQQATFQADAQWLSANPNASFTVEGHCDDRGSTEYNLALGENRANTVKQALVQAGVAADRIKTISYGKEKPFCTEETEECWQQNRVDHFVYGQQ